MKKWLVRLIPLLALAALMVAAYLLGLDDYLSFEVLQTHRQGIVGWVDNHFLIAPLVFMGIYLLSTALSIPGGIYLSLAGGFLFGQPWGTLYVVVGATLGATIIYLVAKTALGDPLREKAGPRLKKMEAGFRKDQISYLFFLRLVPAFPFWLVNVAPAFFGVTLWTYVWTTFLGIIPGAFVFVQAGTGLGAILDSEEGFSVEGVLNIHVKIALIALAIIALIPIVVRKIREKRRNDR